MKTYIFLTAYGLADDLLRCYEAATQKDVKFLLFLHSTQPDVVSVCEQLAKRRNVKYFPYGENRGMSKSVNEAIAYAHKRRAEVFMAINDDVMVGKGDIDRMIATTRENPACSFVTVKGYVQRTNTHVPLWFSCVAWPMRALKQVGLFDENFYPFYFEDCDWRWRASLMGLSPLVLSDGGAVHGGSKTFTHVPGEETSFDTKFLPNRNYYIVKWGGEPGAETYRVPFNDSRYGLTIEPEHADDPYPGRGR